MSYEQMQDPTQQTEEAPHASDATNEDGSFEGDPTFFAEGKKPVNRGALMLGGLVILGAVVIWFMYFRGSPPAAQAGTAQPAGEQIKEFLDSGNINLMKQTLKDSQKIVEQFREQRPQVPLTALKGNPFRELAPKHDTGPVVQDDDDTARKKAAFQTALADLHLQSVILRGRRRSCLINNTLYIEGQKVGVFTLEKVTATGVIVAGDQWRWEVPMPK